MAQRFSKELVVVLYLEKNLTKEEIGQIEEKLKHSNLITKLQFISSTQALERFQSRFPQLQGIIENLKINPFPPSYELEIEEKNLSPEETASFLDQMRKMAGVDDVQFNRDWIEKMQSISRLVKAVGFFLGGILILASFFIISNVIKLNVFARKEEIEILRTVGATNNFIRIPFLVEGIILGILGGVLSLILLFILIKIFPFYVGKSLGAFQELFNFRYLTLGQGGMLICGGAIIGFLGSFSSLARFLKGERQ